MAGDSKAPSIPEWQRQGAAEGDVPTELDEQQDSQEATSSASAELPPSRAALLEQAAAFLKHDDIRDASTDRKISFLESKGLDNEEIQQLLGVSRNVPASSSSASSSTIADATSTSNPVQSTLTAQGEADSPSPQPPPIITYPEFLLHASRPAPLVTTSRILTTLYVTAATAATVHAAQTYLFTPMLESLTSARHTLLEGTTQNLETLNEKLSANVSTVPKAAKPKKLAAGLLAEDDFPDSESEASDPTELFHVDAGVQTDEHTTFSPSSSTTSSNSPPSSLTSQMDRLRSLCQHLESLDSSGEELSVARETARTKLHSLTDYLEDLRFGRTSGRLGGGSSGANWEIKGYGAKSGGGQAKQEEEEVDKVRREIRGIKGVLLSARSFPSGAGGGGSGSGAKQNRIGGAYGGKSPGERGPGSGGGGELSVSSQSGLLGMPYGKATGTAAPARGSRSGGDEKGREQ